MCPQPVRKRAEDVLAALSRVWEAQQGQDVRKWELIEKGRKFYGRIIRWKDYEF
jgi:hypothetical protein